MISTKTECLDRVEVFADSPEIVSALRELAEEATPSDRYWLLEAAVHIEGQHDLIRSMAHHLRKAEGADAGSIPDPE
ncbi:hypothetical protein D3C72_2323950 [compost metagenome]